MRLFPKPKIGPTSPTSQNLAYLAGILDGEGSIRVMALPRKNMGSKCSVQLRISQTYCHNILRILQETFGGSLGTIEKKGKLIAYWQLGGDKGYLLLAKVFPYLVGKKHQARIALELHRCRLTPENEGKYRELSFLKKEVIM